MVSICAVGDVQAWRENVEEMFDNVRDVLKKADISFGNLEMVISERGQLQVHTRTPTPRHPGTLAALKNAGFDILSLANNKCMDYGIDALLDSIELLRCKGISVVGVGRDISEACAPVHLVRDGLRVAFLAYSALLPEGWAAAAAKPGCAPIRILTHYVPTEYQPEAPVRILSVPLPEDKEALLEQVRAARSRADVVVVSFHWGLHWVRAKLTMYERDLAHAVIDAGGDLVLGHGPHLLKGIEVYRGKPVLYSLGNFAFDLPIEFFTGRSTTYAALRTVYSMEPDPNYPTYAFPPDARKTMIAKIEMDENGIRRLSYLPVSITKQGTPEILSLTDPRFAEVRDYVEAISHEQGLETQFSVEGAEVVVRLS